jgi:filamentous hemagglutinin family protein
MMQRKADAIASVERCSAGGWLRSIPLSLAVVGVCAAALSDDVHASPPATALLPLPCVPGACGAHGATRWVTAGQATATATKNVLNVVQSTPSAILNWSSFDVGSAATVVFHQPSSAAVALNRIFQGNPTQIFGIVKANGQLYLINQNGFIFGSTSKVSVGGLLASSLNMTDATFNAGLLNTADLAAGNAQLASDGRTSVLDNAGNPVLRPDGQPLPVQIVVKPGAQLSTNAASERLLLVSSAVDNGGSISAPDGQVIVAAGQKLYLTASADPNLRGLLVEVDAGGTTTNETTGQISTPRGNVTLLGLAVNQLGLVSATTSVSVNGSIRLLARDTTQLVQVSPGDFQLNAHRGGTLTLGPQSVTEVLPDPTSGPAVDAQVQPLSAITYSGQSVFLEGGSQTRAPGGDVAITARVDPSFVGTPAPEDARLRVDSGAVIDVAGDSATVPVSRNIIQVQLRATELADDPYQRNGPLYRQTAYVDARVGTPIANVSGEVGLIERSVQERLSQGGTVTLDSSGDVVVAHGASVNVSGGAVDYTPGWIQTTQLVGANGAMVDIGSANPAQSYVGVFNPTIQSISNRWGVITIVPTASIAHYDPGYVQGAAAGTVEVLAPTMVLQGRLIGTAVSGQYQRQANTIVPGGLLEIGLPPNPANPQQVLRAPTIDIVDKPVPVVVADTAALPYPQTLELPVPSILANGFSRISVTSDTSITLEPGVPLSLPAAGLLNLSAARVELDSRITAPGGSLAAAAIPTSMSALLPPQALGVVVGNGVTLDVRGNWTNDFLALGTVPVGPVLVNGGSIVLDGGGQQLSIGSRDSFQASGGAWLNAAGGLSGGKGGSIALSEGGGGTLTLGDGIGLDAYGVQGAQGGSLSLAAARISVGSGDAVWARAQTVTADPVKGGVLNLDATLFARYGFDSVSLTADVGPLSKDPAAATIAVRPGTTLSLAPEQYYFSAAAFKHPSAADVTGFLAPTLTPLYQLAAQGGGTLSFEAVPNVQASTVAVGSIGNIVFGRGSTVAAGPETRVLMQTLGSIELDGAITTHGGTISAQVPNPTLGYENGYVPGLHVDLGPKGLLDVSGEAIYVPNAAGLLTGAVLPGGAVSLSMDRGSVVAEAGSVIDFAGTQAALDLVPAGSNAAPKRAIVASAGGALSIAAPESVSLLAKLLGHAGTGDTGSAPGGSLSVALSRVNGFAVSPDLLPTFPSGPRAIELSKSPPGVIQAPASGLAVLDPATLVASGIDSLTLLADQVRVDNGVSASLARRIVLDTPAIVLSVGARASLTAPYLAAGTGGTEYAAVAASPGTGVLSLTGSESVLLFGSLAFQGVDQATINSRGEIDVRGTFNQTGLAPQTLAVAGSLTLRSAAVVPSTATEYEILAAGGTLNTVAFRQSGSAPPVPLSVDGSLTVTADTILQAGTLYAPFGTIDLSASRTLTLAPGSRTSVSGNAALLPYGIVENGTTWVYGLTELSAAPVTGVPARQVLLNAPSLTLASGAAVDVRGGGDLHAYQWTPGTGGTKDALAPSVIPGLYAILPSLGAQAPPYDPLTWDPAGIAPQSDIYLSGGGGVPAGTYALLPARYALLPGAYLVQAVPGYTDLQPGTAVKAASGAPIVAGYLTFGGVGLGGTRYSGFMVEPGSFAHALANYTDQYASQFFSDQATHAGAPRPTLPADAGTVVLTASTSLAVAPGSILGAGAATGEGALVEISAPAIEVDPGTGAPPSVAGAVHLSAASLLSWKPGRLLLGGTYGADGSLDVAANSVAVTAGSVLAADEIVLAANTEVSVGAGAVVETTSAAAGKAPASATLAVQTPLPLTGSDAPGAAFLAVSDRSWLVPQRPATNPSTLGSVAIAAGGRVNSRGSLTLDAPDGASLAAGALSGPGASWALGAGHVVFGSTPVAGALVLDGSTVGALSEGSAVQIASTGAIDLAQPVNIGHSSTGALLPSLTLIGASLNNLAPAGSSSQFSADQVTLGGTQTAAPPVAGSGTLTVTAQTLNIGPGVVAINGFSQVTLTGSDVLIGRGTGGLATSGNLTVQAGVITAAAAANAALAAPNGLLTLAAAGGSAVPPRASLETGGAITLSGADITDNAMIALPSGVVTLSAGNNISLGSAAQIDVAGAVPAGVAGGAGSAGGRIVLSAGGSLTQGAGSSVTVAGATGAGAGQILVRSGGPADLEGHFNGAAGGASQATGAFTIQAGTLADFLQLNSALESGGFTRSRDFIVHNGNLVLPAGATITAREVTLEADSGNVTIAGDINASGTGTRGSISAFAGNTLTVSDSASLQADGDAQTRGGLITLAAASGTLALGQTALVSATGANAAGELILRAPATAADVAVTGVPADLTHVDQVVIEASQGFALSAAPTPADFAAIQAAVSTYAVVAAPAALGRLGLAAAPNASFSPYLQLTAAGDLTLGSLDLTSWRFGGSPATLAFEASGSLTVNGTINDGFGTTRAGLHSNLDLLPGPSSTLAFVAGADLTAATARPVDSVIAGADLVLAPGAIVRTGTGDVTLAASQDIQFGAGAAVLTGGLPGAPALTRPSFLAFPDHGGSITVDAGRDITAVPAVATVGDWQPRRVVDGMAAWGIVPQAFDWTLGALGGGDVAIGAGRDVVNVSAAVADSGVAGASNTIVQYGAGNLSVVSGRDTVSSDFYVGHGSGTIGAYGALTSNLSDPLGESVGTLLQSGSASYSVTARTGINLEGDVEASLLFTDASPASRVYYHRYNSVSALSVSSASGDIEFNTGRVNAIGALIGVLPAFQSYTLGFLILPANVRISAFAGDVNLGGISGVLFPSDRGQLSVYAHRSLSAGSIGFEMSDAPDSLVATPSTPATNAITPVDALGQASQSARHRGDLVPVSITAGQDISALVLRVPKAVTIAAGRDVAGLNLTAENTNAADVSSVTAGRDVVYGVADSNSNIVVEGGGSFDLTAGRQVDLGLARGITTTGTFQNPFLTTNTGANVTVIAGLSQPLGVDPPGPGPHSDFVSLIIGASLDPATGKLLYQQALSSYLAGLGIEAPSFTVAANEFRGLPLFQQLPFLTQVLTSELVRSGREYNNLPGASGSSSGPSGSTGANQSNLDKLINNLVEPSSVYRAELVSYVEAATGQKGLNYDTALAQFEKFPTVLQVAFRYVRGYTAIDALFPDSNSFDTVINYEIAANGLSLPGVHPLPPLPYVGDLSMAFSRIYTLQGGDISILAPGGAVDVGLATLPPDLPIGFSRAPSDLGIVTEQSGDVLLYTRNDVLVNQSRVFTLGGGNIAMWSATGSIDAGEGAKTSVSAPPPTITTDANGNVVVNFSATVAGSGIRTITTSPDQLPGNVDLVAPIGTVNAGDAGIGASGNLNVAAATVAGLDNITVGGVSTGVPPVAGGIGLALAPVTSASASATASQTQSLGAEASRATMAPLAQSALGWLDVFVTGLGEDACRPDDVECLKRQRHP